MGLFSCTENIDESNLYTFTGETIQDYLRTRPEQFSSFDSILGRIGYDNILSAYGDYTCFAPDNNAVRAYIDSLYNDKEDNNVWTVGGTLVKGHNGMTALGLEGLTDSLCRDIALIHLLYTKVLSADLSKSSTYRTMLNRDINTALDDRAMVRVNTNSVIDQKNMDVELENGVVHHIDHVITRSNAFVLSKMEQVGGYTLFIEALKACGLEKDLEIYRRDNITIPQSRGTKDGSKVYIPEECLLGYTVFAESDEVLKANGITDLKGLAAYAKKVYENCADADGWYDYFRNNNIQVVADENYTEVNNVLNMFIRYHILKTKVPYSKLVRSYNEVRGVQLYEYYETLLPYTLMKVTQVNQRYLYINHWESNSTLSDVPLETGTIHEVKSLGAEIYSNGVEALNGYIHPISNMLVYDNNVPNGVLKERMRFDDLSLLPEMTTNSLRGIEEDVVKALNGGEFSGGFGGNAIRVPEDYCDNIRVYNGDNTQIYYLPGQSGVGWSNYQGDELNCVGAYDFALRLPPVPDGVYELRMGYTANGNRGMVQIYLGESSDLGSLLPVDIPINMSGVPEDNADGSPEPIKGWCLYTKTSDDGVQTDIDMRNLGWMRGPLYYTVGQNGSVLGRANREDLRRIITRRSFKQGEYWLRFKTALPQNKGTEFHLDYIEFCPENVYNNSTYAEDMF